ncbi:hypothetical protein KSC_038460 [Ktedonobacter sp. SOSP1-52]|uniref:hypothetical protein n=1 Tax=Ktedonobacter sp. SOSP1-52 TaxID=2778366 RepID=UPI0019151505|nr:hypothetical protein [Ktedonobacter sp. SOSP1-52]GHO64954.1 hypothetical protein KSC_038460 [Ktedonobacter sp. SOSP1-52]
MNNFYSSNNTPQAEELGTVQEVITIPTKKSLGARFMHWWHGFASPPPLPENATVPQREEYRRARTVSVVTIVFFPMLVGGDITSLAMPNPYLFQVVFGVVIAFMIAPFFNRAGHILIAGLLVTIPLQFVIIYYILTTMPLNETALQVYDMLALVILLALAVLPLRAIWILTILDCVFVVLDLIYQPRTTSFTDLLNHEGFMGILVRPLILLLLLTGVSAFLLMSVARAARQSYEAEFIANIERATAQQNELEAEAKRELEESIQQMVQAHTDTMNGRTGERISYPTSKVLWPLVGILNSLWTRLQRSQQREQELAQLQEHIMVYNELLRRTLHSPEQPITPFATKTALAPLALTVANLQKELLNRLRGQTRRTEGGMF